MIYVSAFTFVIVNYLCKHFIEFNLSMKRWKYHNTVKTKRQHVYDCLARVILKFKSFCSGVLRKTDGYRSFFFSLLDCNIEALRLFSFTLRGTKFVPPHPISIISLYRVPFYRTFSDHNHSLRRTLRLLCNTWPDL